MYVIRRAGGLETRQSAVIPKECVIRHVGGLENNLLLNADAKLIIRRTGGLDFLCQQYHCHYLVIRCIGRLENLL